MRTILCLLLLCFIGCLEPEAPKVLPPTSNEFGKQLSRSSFSRGVWVIEHEGLRWLAVVDSDGVALTPLPPRSVQYVQALGREADRPDAVKGPDGRMYIPMAEAVK